VSGSASEPEITRKKIRKAEAAGLKPRLFLEEIDKTKSTKFKLDSLFEVIDGIYENKGQLVISSNLTLSEFTETFGPEFARRVAEMCNVVNFFEGATV
jgi:DNA replication protein DnaC